LKIVLMGTEEERKIIFENLQMLTDDHITYNLETGEVVFSDLPKEEPTSGHQKGTQLISELIESDYSINIYSIDKGGSYMTTHDFNNSKNGIGTGSNVYLDINTSPEIPTLDPSTGTVKPETRPLFISLGHELCHSYGAMTGTMEEVGYTQYTYLDSTKNMKWITTKNEELVNVGLMGERTITENDIRKEHGLKLRGSYSWGEYR